MLTSTLNRNRLAISSAAAGLVFLVLGPAASDLLFDYGFAIFSPTVTQNAALVLAAAISLPTGLFFDAWPVPRLWMAVNGACWGALAYLAAFFVAQLLNKRKRQD